ncbi:hypothetical protein ACERZ8_01285 [Tateyamaria armeniaca]|uniref:DUF4864 domain-containing protein n=1 Tax=Tateyamaria armeniaca TaxID=2518930 RepID=A0ABW8UPB4_9RHOB
MRQLLIMIAGAVMCAATAAVAQDAVDRFDIAINAEDEAAQPNLMSLARTFALVAPRTSGVRKASRLEFRSGAGLIDNSATTAKLRTALPPALANSVAQLQSVGGPCDISRHRFDDTDVLLVLHNSDEAQPQDIYRCFIAGLWIYHAGSTESVSVNDWRTPYARILGSLASGRPAFSGFDTEEN